ncbi:MAG: hypothetical protein NC483_02745 [Ruminococcus sp.]|nr:hypothetical protein [Ruminococcus sp.]
MLNMNNIQDKVKMMQYYRTSDMLNLIYFFPKLSPVKELVIVENKEDYLNNKEFLNKFDQNRVDTLKGRKPILGIENAGNSNNFYDALVKVKEKDDKGVLVLFNINTKSSERYERYAGISVGVNIGESVIIDAVSKGFDGREVSKSICTHERYYIPWYDLRKISIENFKDYQTYQISDINYKISRNERIKFLKSIGLNPRIFRKYIPLKYQKIPDFIWLSVIRNLLKELEKSEDILVNLGFTNFAISGHTEGKDFMPWQMFDKSRYTSLKN